MTEQLQIYITESSGYLTAEEKSLVRAKESFESLGETLTESVVPIAPATGNDEGRADGG